MTLKKNTNCYIGDIKCAPTFKKYGVYEQKEKAVDWESVKAVLIVFSPGIIFAGLVGIAMLAITLAF
jgi:hypothetical protein